MNINDCYDELLAYTDALLDAIIAAGYHEEITETPAVKKAYTEFNAKLDRYFKKRMDGLRKEVNNGDNYIDR